MTSSSSSFTSVATRRTLDTPFYVRPSDGDTPQQSSRPFPHEPQLAPSPPPARTFYSDKVRNYVSRSFSIDVQRPDIAHEDLQKKLMAILGGAQARDDINLIDWDTYPLPHQLILEERMRSAAPSSNQPFFVAKVPSDNPAPVNTNNAKSKKRKSKELEQGEGMKPSESDAVDGFSSLTFENRISYPEPVPNKRREKKQRKFREETGNLDIASKSWTSLEQRLQRFKGSNAARLSSTLADSSSVDTNNQPVVGTCQDLEKRYFRLTSAPKAESVRPLPVLRKTLDLLKRKWKDEGNYNYICDQFKSLRQDLTVQHIKNDFTVVVYEIHARIALEKGDLGEYNQCQTQLRALYKQKLGGHPGEFVAYRILYFIHTRNQIDMNNVLADLTDADRGDPAVRHALQTRSALTLGNYHRFFQLFLNTPNMGGYLMDMFIVRERLSALARICKAYKQIPVKFLTEELAFDSDEACCDFLCEYDASDMLERIDDDSVRFLCAKAAGIFERARKVANRSVDIKGQI